MSSLVRGLFPRSRRPVRSSRRRRGLPRRAGQAWGRKGKAAARRRSRNRRRIEPGVRPDLESLEARAMLAADDIVVSLVGNQVVLTLDPAGTEVTNLSTTYAPRAGMLRINAASAGTLSSAAPIPGITIDPATDTIAVNLKTIPTFAGISVVGDVGTDSVTIGPGGVNLAAVTRGAAAQGLNIDTGAGVSDTIVVANAVSTKGRGDISFTTKGQPTKQGILLAAIVPTVRSLLLMKDLSSRHRLRPGGFAKQFAAQLDKLAPEETSHLPRKKDGSLNAYPLSLSTMHAANYSLPELQAGFRACATAAQQLFSGTLEDDVVLARLLVGILARS